MNKKNLITVVIIGITAIIIGGTIAYFQDMETSVGNKFVAGKFNLKIDNTCHYNGKECVCSSPENCFWQGTQEPCFCTWQATDLDGQLFFNLLDVKPGDFGEDTISLHVDNNDAWLCAKVADLVSDDNGCESPENKIDTTCGAGEGELKDNLFFTVWEDTNCNNILDEGENVLVNNKTAQSGVWPIADSTTGNGPLQGGKTYCLGVSWNVPLETSNVIQSDSLVGNVIFTAVQSRHMTNYVCGQEEPQPQCEPECNDQNVCTTDTCVNGRCIFVSNTNPCDDSNLCTENDTCSNGICVGTPKNCNDNNVCTNDACNPATGCIYVPNNDPCNDENTCTINDVCSNGQCVAGSLLNCDDGNACTIDSCDPVLGCIHTFSPAGSPCDDGVFCNGSDSCNGNGVCANHSGNPCGSYNDSDCTGGCNEAADNCTSYEPPGSPCNDGQFCNGTDTCNGSGSCVNHSGDPCGPVSDSNCMGCDELLDSCSTIPEPAGSPCDDGIFCNGTDTCANFFCLNHSGNPCPGPDNDTDCAESCNEEADNCTAFDPNGSSCNGAGWYCSNGSCVH